MPDGHIEVESSENLVLEMIAKDAPLDSVLRTLATLIDRQSKAGMCCIFLVDPAGAWRVAAAPGLPPSFARALDGVSMEPKRVIVSDVATDPLFEDYRDVAMAHGVRSCWFTPICSSDGAALGTVAVYFTQQRVPGEPGIAAVERTTTLARIAIERGRKEL